MRWGCCIQCQVIGYFFLKATATASTSSTSTTSVEKATTTTSSTNTSLKPIQPKGRVCFVGWIWIFTFACFTNINLPRLVQLIWAFSLVVSWITTNWHFSFACSNLGRWNGKNCEERGGAHAAHSQREEHAYLPPNQQQQNRGKENLDDQRAGRYHKSCDWHSHVRYCDQTSDATKFN